MATAEPPSHSDFVLKIDEVAARMDGGWKTPSLSMQLRPGELGLVSGRCGTGKSLLAEVIAGIRRPGLATTGRLAWSYPDGDVGAGDARRGRVALVPQDARLAVLPTDRVSTLLGGRAEALELLHRLQVDPARVHLLPMSALSMSERRRALLANALSSGADLVVLDGFGEILDPSSRGILCDLLRECCARGQAILVTSRDEAPSGLRPDHSVSLGVLHPDEAIAVPLLAPSERASVRPSERPHEHPLVEVEHVHIIAGRGRLLRRAPAATPVDGATFFLRHGEVLVLFGPGGAGKTTLLEAMAGLLPIRAGRIRVSGLDVSRASGSRLRKMQRRVQLVLQDAQTALDGSRTVREHLEEASRLGRGARIPANAWLDRLGLPKRLLELPADVLSAGEAARVNLGRALAVSPRAVLFDGPRGAAIDSDDGILTSLILAEQARGTTFLLATSEPGIARGLADRVAVIDQGRIIELGPRDAVLECAAHPRTDALLRGEVGALQDPRKVSRGCPEAGRCGRESLRCAQERPLLELVAGAARGHRVACFNPLQRMS